MKLFKFYSFANKGDVDRFIDNICNRRLPCNHPIKFNDPFEGVYFFTGLTKMGKKELKEFKKPIRKQIPPDKKNLFDIQNAVLTNRAIVSCLCKENVFKNDAFSDLMWAHYANNHEGACVEYEFDNDLAKSFECDEDGYKIYNYQRRGYHFLAKKLILHNVKYCNTPHVVQFKNDISVTDELDFLFTKSKVWEYENEVRIVASLITSADNLAFDLSTYYAIEYKEECLKSIRFGINIKEKYKKRIIKIIKELDVQCSLYQSYISDSSCYLQYQTISE